MKQSLTVLILALMMLPVFAFAETEYDDAAVLSIANLFYYEPGDKEENPVQTRADNEAYRAMISELVQKSDFRFASETLTWNVKETLATDDFTAVTWQMTNTSDKILYIQSNEFLISYNGIAYDVAGGYHWANCAVLPGETLNARLHGVLWEHCEPGEGKLEMPVTIYALTSEAYDAAKSSGGVDEFYPEETALTYVEDVAVLIPLNMGKSECFSALQNGEPILRQMDGYTLKIAQAEMNAVNAVFSVERIYSTENEALQDPAAGDSFWEYTFPAENGVAWIQTAYGTIPDQPVQLEDGAWAWQYSCKIYYMFSRPEQIIVRSIRYHAETGYNEGEHEDCVITFPLAE